MQDLVKEGGCEHCCTVACIPDSQHPGKARSSRERGFSSPRTPWSVCCLLSCLCSVFCQGSHCCPTHCLSLQAMGLPDAGAPLSCLSSAASQALTLLPRVGIPFPGAGSAAHLHPPCFV